MPNHQNSAKRDLDAMLADAKAEPSDERPQSRVKTESLFQAPPPAVPKSAPRLHGPQKKVATMQGQLKELRARNRVLETQAQKTQADLQEANVRNFNPENRLEESHEQYQKEILLARRRTSAASYLSVESD